MKELKGTPFEECEGCEYLGDLLLHLGTSGETKMCKLCRRFYFDRYTQARRASKVLIHEGREVVTCKDCKHWANAEDYDCEIHSGAFGAEDFCSYGERSE